MICTETDGECDNIDFDKCKNCDPLFCFCQRSEVIKNTKQNWKEFCKIHLTDPADNPKPNEAYQCKSAMETS
jgi:hypothetical protein